jgi:hypothetical protein
MHERYKEKIVAIRTRIHPSASSMGTYNTTIGEAKYVWDPIKAIVMDMLSETLFRLPYFTTTNSCPSSSHPSEFIIS